MPKGRVAASWNRIPGAFTRILSALSLLALGAADAPTREALVRTGAFVTTADGRTFYRDFQQRLAPFTGRLLSRDSTTGVIVDESLRNGLRHGRSLWRNAQGTIVEMRTYSRGNKVGVHHGWWDNGLPRFTCAFSKGERNGPCQEWFVNGRLATQQHYRNGYEEGLQQGWKSDGTTEFSYVRRNGRRYGLRGDLTCEVSKAERS